jgi:hypothetical protein
MESRKSLTGILSGLLIATSLTMFISSCSSSSSPASNNTNNSNSSIVHPKLGSTFTDSSYTRDTSLNPIPKTGTVIVYTLTDTNFSIGGKTNVFEYTSTSDTVYLHYESNGDFSNYATFGISTLMVGQEWVTLPSQSQGTIPLTSFSSVLVADTIQVSGSAKGTGSEVDNIGTQAVNASNTSLSVQAYAPQLLATTTGFVNTSFAPSLGFLTHYDVSTHGVFYGFNLSGGIHRFLISYNLK